MIIHTDHWTTRLFTVGQPPFPCWNPYSTWIGSQIPSKGTEVTICSQQNSRELTAAACEKPNILQLWLWRTEMGANSVGSSCGATLSRTLSRSDSRFWQFWIRKLESETDSQINCQNFGKVMACSETSKFGLNCLVSISSREWLFSFNTSFIWLWKQPAMISPNCDMINFDQHFFTHYSSRWSRCNIITERFPPKFVFGTNLLEFFSNPWFCQSYLAFYVFVL